MRQNRSGTGSGFTLMELALVVAILAIFGVTVVVKTAASQSISVLEQAEYLRRNLSHVQYLAMAYGVSLRFQVDSGSSYSVKCRGVQQVTGSSSPLCTSVGASVVDPATGQLFSVALSDGATLAATSATLDFDSMGRPSNSTTLMPPNAAINNAAVSYTLSGGGTTAYVDVWPVTGYAEVR